MTLTPDEALAMAQKRIERVARDGLQELNLSGMGLTDIPPEIGRLTQLRSLNLGHNLLTYLPPEVGQLADLQSLLLYGNRLTSLPPEISHLSQLQTIHLGHNRLTGLLPEFRQLKRLRSLTLANNQLTSLPPEIVEFRQLRTLDLSGLNLTGLPPEIGNLARLETLRLARTRLDSLAPEIGNLVLLRSLHLQNNLLTVLPPEIGQLAQLRSLNLGDNRLRTVPPEIGKLAELRSLYLYLNQLTSLPLEIFQLAELELLNVGGNGLTNLSGEIGQLAALQTLFLYNNQLTSLPPEIGQLARLVSLHVGNNQLRSLPPEIGRLAQLRVMDFSSNKLLDLPPEMGGLARLRSLKAADNQLQNLPKELGRLTRLRELSIHHNSLSTISPEILRLPLSNLALSKNPFPGLPAEVVSQGVTAIKAYLRDHARQSKTERPSRAKLILVGGAEFGKSSLLRALRGEVVVKGEFSQTHGIEIRQLNVPHPGNSARVIQLNTWDFGGQVIYHATHQFFLSDHALFVLVWSARRGVQQADLPYWLDMIRSRAPHAKVLLVATHLDEAKSVDLDFDSLLKQYPELLYKTQFAVSCTEGTNIDGLVEVIQRLASQIRAVDYEWPSHWLKASQALCARRENLLAVSEARGILASNGVNDGAAQETLLRWLHELGDVVYYPEVDELGDTVLLKPEWITQNVAQILDDQEVKDSRGVLKPQHVARLWSGVEVKLQRVLTALMDHYDLTYPTDVNNERIVVECLQHKPTDYLLEWQKRELQPHIHFRYHFDPRFQPGIPTWFIARAHRYSTNNQWRRGALLEDRDYDSACLMEADPERSSVMLTVRGPNPPYFFGVMNRTFEDTLKRYPGLQYTAYIPCPCGGRDGESGCRHEWEYKDALDATRSSEHVEALQCPKTRRQVPVTSILNGVHFDSYRSIREKLEDLNAGQQELLQEFRASFAQLQNQFTLDLTRKQNELDQDSPGVFTLYHPRFRSLDSTLGAWKRILVDGEGEELELCVFCEFPGDWHLTEHSLYRFRPPADWIEAVAPYWRPLQKVLKTCAPVLKAVGKAKFAFLDAALGRGLESAAELSAISQEDRVGPLSGVLGQNDEPIQMWEQAQDTLRSLIQELDKNRADPSSHWGGLRQTHTPSGEILWLCPYHKAKMFPFAGR